MKASTIMFISEFTHQEFDRLVGKPWGNTALIGAGVDAIWFDVPREPPAGRPHVVFVGNVKPHKNLVRLLEAFALVKDRIPHDLVILGKNEGFITGDDRVAVAARSLKERVRITGYLSDEEVRKTVANADLLVMPSLYEGFGLPVIEAMACGCPVLSSNAASLPEAAGDAVIYFNPLDVDDLANKLLSVLSDTTLRQRLSELGRVRARRLDWANVAQRVGRCFDEALQ